MFADILSPASYIMINRDAVHTLGLTPAVYCAELLIIYKKVIKKKAFINDELYFKVDRKYIEDETSLTVADQLVCDKNLEKLNIVKILKDDPDCIYFDIELYGSILASEDIKLLDNVSAKMKTKQPKGVKQAQHDRIVMQLKDSVECGDTEIKFCFNDWIDSIMGDPKKYLTVPQVRLFKQTLEDYCNKRTDIPDAKGLAIKLLNIATTHAYINCEWAINVYEGKRKPAAKTMESNIQTRVTEQKVTTKLSDKAF